MLKIYTRVSYDGLKVSGSPQALVEISDEKRLDQFSNWPTNFVFQLLPEGLQSSLTGGATPFLGGWVMDLSRLSSIEVDCDNMLVRCGPGVVVGDLQEGCGIWSFIRLTHLQRNFVPIGGNIACNAGGLRCVKYGVTRDYVLALSGYLPTGESFGGGQATRKFATGYNLRDLWIGSEGTLGVVTGIRYD